MKNMGKNVKDTGVKHTSKRLTGRQIAFAVCGGIGAVEVVKCIRELRRNGADVTAFLTPSVKEFVTRLSIEWACAKPSLETVGAEVEYLNAYDLIVVAPTTLNTLSKFALGLTDNAVTLLVATQLGRKGKVLLVPTMNIELRKHPIYESYAQVLKSWGADFLESTVEEDRIKMPSPEDLIAGVVKCLKK